MRLTYRKRQLPRVVPPKGGRPRVAKRSKPRAAARIVLDAYVDYFDAYVDELPDELRAAVFRGELDPYVARRFAFYLARAYHDALRNGRRLAGDTEAAR